MDENADADLFVVAHGFAMQFCTPEEEELPVGSSGSVKCAETGATITYGDNRVVVQVARDGGDRIHAWTLALRRVGDRAVGWFFGDYPTDRDVERIKMTVEPMGLDLASALRSAPPESIFDDSHRFALQMLANAVSYPPPPPPMKPVKRGFNLGKKSNLPGGHDA